MKFLATTRLFSDLDDEVLEEVLPCLSTREIDKDQVVVEQGESATELLLVSAGTLEIWQRNPDNGLEYTGPGLSAGDDLGLPETILGTQHPLTARTTSPVTLHTIARQDLLDLSRREPAVAASMLTAIAERLQSERVQHASQDVDLARLRVDEELWTLLPRSAITKFRTLPLARNGGILNVGFVDCSNRNVVDDVRRLLPGHNIVPIAIDATDFDRFYRNRVGPALDRRQPDTDTGHQWFRTVQKKSVELTLIDNPTPSPSVEEKGRQVRGEQVVALMNRLIGEALELEASDIHIEPSEHELVVRYRVDGRLKKRPEPIELRFQHPLVSRLKVLGNMDIAERRRAQDGRLAVLHENRRIDFRLATVPTRFGETIVLRILDPASILIDLERLIVHEPSYRAARWMIEQPQGMVIVTGPTGSGKTTTIYSAMLRLREDEVNIVTIEDPIEYTIKGLTQVQVNDAAGVGFANSIRHFLRQDPDIIVVGETRDPITASTSVEAALTGHLVFTSLHANDALSTIVRLQEMGVDSFLAAHTVIGVISQRLVRKVCTHCREPVDYHVEMIRPLGIFPTDEAKPVHTFHKGRGCIHCNYLGYRGRVGVFEVLKVDERLQPAIAAGESVTSLQKRALDEGLLIPMRDYCRHLLTNGITTPEELARILFAEQ